MNSDDEQENMEGSPQEAEDGGILQEQLEEVDRERAQFKEMALRTQADLANYRRRVEEERDELNRSVAARFLLKLLPVLDDLQRALEYTPQKSQEETWLEGIRLIERSLQSLLVSEGVTTIEAEGQLFDPWEHEAMLSVDTEDCQQGTVVSVLRKGYKHHGKVLRPAQVTVANGNANQQEPPAQQEAQTTEAQAKEAQAKEERET